jgi:hypothetical protein
MSYFFLINQLVRLYTTMQISQDFSRPPQSVTFSLLEITKENSSS